MDCSPIFTMEVTCALLFDCIPAKQSPFEKESALKGSKVDPFPDDLKQSLKSSHPAQTDGRTHKRPRCNMSLDFLRSWWHNNRFADNIFTLNLDTYPLLQINMRRGEALLMSTHNGCFHGEIRKMSVLLG